MKFETVKLSTGKKPEVLVNCWTNDNPSKVKGSVVLIHGMAEYSYRYRPFAEYLVENGYDVFATDHLGHGVTVSKADHPAYGYGHWPKDGFFDSVARADSVVDYAHKVRPDKPVMLFGHSLGSFLATGYYELHPEKVNAVVICGSAYNNVLYRSSALLTGVMNVFKSKKKKAMPSKMLSNANMSTMNKKSVPFEDKYETHNGWLSYDEDNVKAYDADPELGFDCDFNFYYSMFHGQQKIWKKSALKKMGTKRPVFIIAGLDDPVGNYGKDPVRLYEFLKKDQRGQKISCKIYAHAKHEILNEKSVRDEVEKDILAFFDGYKD